MTTGAHADDGPWRDEIIEVVRAVSGGLLFGVPLLFTMEVWWTGTHTDPSQMLLILVLLFIPLLVLNRTEGFRSSRDVRLRDAAADSVEALAIGIVASGAVLILLHELTAETPIQVWLGKVLNEAVPFCLGIGVARHFLQGGRSSDDDRGDDQGASAEAGGSGSTLSADLADIGATAIGATFVALSIAPTDEIPLIASTMGPAWLLLVVAASLVISYAIVFVAGFAGQEQRRGQEGPFQHPLTETVVCYLVSLGVAALLLWTFQRSLDPPADLLTRVIVLGLPATVGGAAGRLAL
ncbi:TIGR02587 family membrane protein [Aquihabitans daechungensis]|uniref:TIGR02587 family membrane protein n=1 Tax=Aquihabitans daechungensis TaxID=1052257 RepID=UPI003B9ECE05